MIYGTKGTFEQSFKNELIIKKKKDSFTTASIESKYPAVKKYELIDNFIKAILFGNRLIIGKDQMIDAMKVCLKMIKMQK